MKTILTLICVIFSAHDIARAYEYPHDSGIYCGFNYAISPYYHARAMLSITDYMKNTRHGYDLLFSSFATVTERGRSQTIRFSANPIFLLSEITISKIFYRRHGIPYDVSKYFFIPHVISNFRGHYHLAPNRFYLTAGQNTDLYAFCRPAKIFTETIFGAEYRTLWPRRRTPTRFILEVHFPWMRGYLDDKSPYLSLGIAPRLIDMREIID